MTTRKQGAEFRDETPIAGEQSTVQGRKSLIELLDQIEQRAKPKERNLGHGIVQMTPGDPSDVPALVKALRLAIAQLEYVDPDKSGSTAATKADIAQLLRETAGEKK